MNSSQRKKNVGEKIVPFQLLKIIYFFIAHSFGIGNPFCKPLPNNREFGIMFFFAIRFQSGL